MSDETTPRATYCYSTNGENYHGAFGSREAATKEAMAFAEGDGGHVWIGKTKSAKEYLRENEFVGGLAIEQMEEQLADEIAADNPILDYTKAQEMELNELITNFAIENFNFMFWGVEDVQKHEVPEEGETS